MCKHLFQAGKLVCNIFCYPETIIVANYSKQNGPLHEANDVDDNVNDDDNDDDNNNDSEEKGNADEDNDDSGIIEDDDDDDDDDDDKYDHCSDDGDCDD